MYIQINYILYVTVRKGRKHILRHQHISYHWNMQCFTFTMYFYKYCLIFLIVHKLLETRKQTHFFLLLTQFSLLTHISCHYSPINPRTKILQLYHTLYTLLLWFSLSILSLYNGLFSCLSNTKYIHICLLNSLHKKCQLKFTVLNITSNMTLQAFSADFNWLSRLPT